MKKLIYIFLGLLSFKTFASTPTGTYNVTGECIADNKIKIVNCDVIEFDAGEINFYNYPKDANSLINDFQYKFKISDCKLKVRFNPDKYHGIGGH